jgi:hypothetical protein
MTNNQAIILVSLVVLVSLGSIWHLTPPPCQPQPVIHCLDGFYAYTESREGIDHIYCLRKKYEVPEIP